MKGGNLIYDLKRNFTVVASSNCPKTECQTPIYDADLSTSENVVIYNHTVEINDIGDYVQGNVYQDKFCLTEDICVDQYRFFGVESSSSKFYSSNLVGLSRSTDTVAEGTFLDHLKQSGHISLK